MNCGAPLVDRYCGRCGQDHAHPRLRMKTLLGDWFESVLELDWPVVRTVVDLIIRPGRVCREYVDGRRRKYMSPLRYCVYAAAIFALLTVTLDVDTVGGFADLIGAEALSERKTLTEEEIAALTDAERKQLEAVEFVEQNIQFFSLASLPLVVFIQMLAFRGNRLNYAEHAAPVLYLNAQFFLLGAVTLLTGAHLWIWMTIVSSFVMLIYWIWACRVFYGRGWWATTWRSCIILFSKVVLDGLVGAIVVPIML
ncbi:MAG: DUF3667 domain-containing protein [Phycisphaerales bacterium]